jgi:protein phosphatase
VNPFDSTDRPIVVNVCGRTDTGRKRAENQDTFLVADLTGAAADDGFFQTGDADADGRHGGAFVLGPKGALMLVADGMGGAAAGGVASRMAAAWIYKELVTSWGYDRNNTPRQFALCLRTAVETANTRLQEESLRNPSYEGMGTTATVAGFLDGFLYLAQVGDSRAYLARNGEVVQLTRDQSFVQEMVDAGTLTEDEAEKSGQANMILQALGTRPQVTVDLTWQQARRGDLLILCSDGLSRQVKKHEIGDWAVRVRDPGPLCAELIALANERGGPDNITVVAAVLDGDGLQHAVEHETVGRNVYDLPTS